MPRIPRLSLRVRSLSWLLVLLLLAPTVASGAENENETGEAQVSQLVDRRLGESEQIRRRQEWFFSTRRAGAGSEEAMARLRRQGVLDTKALLQAQRKQWSDGAEAELNYWVAKGPAPSTFGGWAFGNVAGRIAAIAVDWDLDILYVGTAAGGLWKSTNDGLSYTSIFDTGGTLAAGAIAVDPNDSNTIWVGTGDNVTGCEGYFGLGLARSTDGGANWEYRNGSSGQDLEDLSSFANVLVDPRDSSHLVVGGRMRGCSSGSEQSGGLFSSNDAGLTWTKRIANLSIYEIAQDPNVLDIYWAATQDGIYKSTDNGVTWTLQTASSLPNGGTGRTELAVSPSDSNTVYALFYSPNEFWRTTDGGASWTRMATEGDACDGQCWYNMVLRVHRTDPDTVYRGTVHIFKSTDGGVTWTDLSNSWGGSQKVHQDTHVLVMDPDDPEAFYVGGDGGTWKSVDGGLSFSNLNGNINSVLFYAVDVDVADTETICGGAQDNSSLARTTSDIWDLQAVTGDGFVCHFNSQDSSYAYITSYPSGGYPSVSRSTTGVLGSFSGITKSGSGIVNGDRINWVTPYLIDPRHPETLYLGTHRVYRSDDYGSHWNLVGPSDMTAGSGSLLSLEINANDTDVLLAGSASGRVWRTTNGGMDWTDISDGLPSRSINDLASDPTNPDRAFATVGGFNTGHLWEWSSAGGWVERGAELPNVPANTVVMLSADDIYVGVDTGIFRSLDGGQSFTPFMNGLAEGMVVTDLKYTQTSNLITAGTYGRGAWQVTIDPIGPIVIYDSVDLPMDEIDGDGDDKVEPGETWALRPKLRNAGGEPALGVTARLASSSPGVTVLDPQTQSYGDINPGETSAAVMTYQFTVAPDVPCGEEIVFDVVDIRSTNGAGVYSDRMNAFTVTVVDSYQDPAITTLLDENFDSSPASWTHEGIDPGITMCFGQVWRDEWKFVTKDAEHSMSYHCGAGPGGSYNRTNYAWLYPNGKDSQGGDGLLIPGDATTVTLTLLHWYDTEDGEDGAQVLIDGTEDGVDGFSELDPEGGYPGTPLATGNCNGLEGRTTFSGNSGGWITSTFDMTSYRGKRVFLAFVFASDRNKSAFEGWYIDEVTVESSVQGDPICQVIEWPGQVGNSAGFLPAAGGDIEASWGPSCNEAALPGQSYALEVGALDTLASDGTYTHAALDGVCSRTSPLIFTPGSAQEYYLVIPNEGGREGGAGTDASGNSRPQADGSCGEPREGACP